MSNLADLPTCVDVLILGGGPAGSALAITLRQRAPNLRVALIERSDYSRPRIGETIPPQVGALLRQLGVWADFQTQGHLPADGTCAAWGHPELHFNEFLFNTSGRGWHLDRARFDRGLAEVAQQRGVYLVTDTRYLAGELHSDRQWQITLDKAGEQRTISAWFVVDATGRDARFARQQGAVRQRRDTLIGMYRLAAAPPTWQDSFALIEAFEQGWGYSALLPNAKLVFALMTDADLARQLHLSQTTAWEACLEHLPHTTARWLVAQAPSAVQTTAGHTQTLSKVVGECWLALGDGASTFDPLSSLGIFKALRSGIYAAYAITDFFAGHSQALPAYAKFIQTEFATYRQMSQSYYAQEDRWSDAPFWKRRSASGN